MTSWKGSGDRSVVGGGGREMKGAHFHMMSWWKGHAARAVVKWYRAPLCYHDELKWARREKMVIASVFFPFFLSLSFWASLAAALHKVLLCSPSGGFFHRTPASHAMHSKTWGPPIYHFSPAALNPLAAAPSRIYYIPPLSLYFTLFYNIDKVSQYRM